MRKNGSSGTYGSMSRTGSNSTNASNIADKVADILEKANSSLPTANDVSAHKQRYHTKNGIVWKDKSSYHRGGNNKI